MRVIDNNHIEGSLLSCIEVTKSQVVAAHAFNFSTWRQRQVNLCEFKASLVYIVSPNAAKDAE